MAHRMCHAVKHEATPRRTGIIVIRLSLEPKAERSGQAEIRGSRWGLMVSLDSHTEERGVSAKGCGAGRRVWEGHKSDSTAGPLARTPMLVSLNSGQHQWSHVNDLWPWDYQHWFVCWVQILYDTAFDEDADQYPIFRKKRKSLTEFLDTGKSFSNYTYYVMPHLDSHLQFCKLFLV